MLSTIIKIKLNQVHDIVLTGGFYKTLVLGNLIESNKKIILSVSKLITGIVLFLISSVTVEK